jgi:ubiquinone/menaquinone biosynthesis C-methylase UbiE
MIKRRTLLSAGAGAVLATGAGVASQQVSAQYAGSGGPSGLPSRSDAGDEIYPPGTLAPRGRFERMERLPTLALESRQNFLRSFRTWVNISLSGSAAQRGNEVVREHNLPTDQQVPEDVALELMSKEPLAQIASRAWLSAQQLTWNGLREEFEGNVDKYLDEMAAVDDYGPILELNPDLDIPAYAKHEIHIMPGGYVGSPVAGHLYHYGTNGFYMGRNDNDDIHVGAARRMVTPADGKVLRILDVGTGIGQFAMALKERFPEAEVWGIDVGGPMVRYAHLRATERKLDVNFAQRLAEDTKFPDNYFDIVTSYIMFHEVEPEATRRAMHEAYRITRPGGVFYPVDFNTLNQPPRTAYQQYRSYMDHRWNCEPWTPKWRACNPQEMIREAGFDLNTEGPAVLPNFGVLNATKPV